MNRAVRELVDDWDVFRDWPEDDSPGLRETFLPPHIRREIREGKRQQWLDSLPPYMRKMLDEEQKRRELWNSTS